MINRLTFFIQKLKLSITLARYDLLCLIDGLTSFSDVIKLASPFVKESPQPLSQKLKSLLSDTKINLPSIFISELAALALDRSGVFFEGFAKEQNFAAQTSVLCQTCPFANQKFYLKLLQEIYDRDFAQYPNAFADFQDRLSIRQDMRLWADKNDDLLKSSALPLQTNWVKTSKQDWVIDSPEPFRLSADLSEAERRNLANFFAKELFEKGIFVFGFRQVAVDSQNHVAFMQADSVCAASYEHCLAVLGKHAFPLDDISVKLQYALRELKFLCSDSIVDEAIKTYAEKFKKKNTFLPPNKDLSEYLSNNYAEEKERLHQSFWSRHVEKKHTPVSQAFSKASLLYWGPALIVGMILFALLHS